MPYTMPPQIAVALSGAHIVGTVNTTIIPAPGVGFRIRVTGGNVFANRSCAAAVVDEILAELASGVIHKRMGGLSLAGAPWAPVDIPEFGDQYAENQGVQLQSSSTVAAGNSGITLYYYIDKTQ